MASQSDHLHVYKGPSPYTCINVFEIKSPGKNLLSLKKKLIPIFTIRLDVPHRT